MKIYLKPLDQETLNDLDPEFTGDPIPPLEAVALPRAGEKLAHYNVRSVEWDEIDGIVYPFLSVSIHRIDANSTSQSNAGLIWIVVVQLLILVYILIS